MQSTQPVVPATNAPPAPAIHPNAPPPPNTPFHDCPILVWMLSLNREATKEEYEACYNVVKECFDLQIPYDPTSAESFRRCITQMLPLLMMRHRRIPRAKWKDYKTPTGKHWIEQSPEDMSPEKFLHSMIGYHLTYCESLCGMAMTQGTQRKVVNIGIGVRRIEVEPRGVAPRAYVESVSHKLTQKELELILKPENSDEVVLRRVSIVLTLKEAYNHAVGQPVGFDYSRLEFIVEGSHPSHGMTDINPYALGDGIPLQGWEFRLFKAQLGVARQDQLSEESYQCVCAFFRGTRGESRFIWYNSEKELESWVQFINIDQMIKVIPKLMA
ncbi:hypothetical protein GYMLUDRAFT_234097 [Collybiopsis luxurians FD-317 M1]|uniref:Uncharacterized protein n=1 Tax=Collybiopsis luxurians FD-317 M1 TaxID=944289 RepID=A0A0D0C9A4_9AGAR|nr:hypothetical protein GYMLUDRAFT_234097 [Collybiopsis luxurians FD-317 M1]